MTGTRTSKRVHGHLSGLSLGDPHPCDEPGGWPEFEITLSYYVTTDDPEAIDVLRRRIFQSVSDVLADDYSEYVENG